MSYRYGAAVFRRAAELSVDSLWIAGGLYGNPLALQSLLALFEREAGEKALVFNGDFHWFDIDARDFRVVNDTVSSHTALRGNVETELAAPQPGAGCGCAYPEWVDDGTVERSNRILDALRVTASSLPALLPALAQLPMHAVAQVAGERIAIVHGDADSLAGWNFSQEALATTEGRTAAIGACNEAEVAVFASSHTCLPVLQRLGNDCVIVNNGAAGMPNFGGECFGLATRISHRSSGRALYGARLGRLHVEAIPLRYDVQAWETRFLAQWPERSDGWLSYARRIRNGPSYSISEALRV